MDPKKYGEFLKSLRKEKGLTQEALADRIFVTSKTVSRWETGRQLPDLEMLQKLAEFYSVDIRDMVAGEIITDKPTSEIEALKNAEIYTEKKGRLRRRKWWILAGIVCVLLAIFIPWGIHKYVEREKGLDAEQVRYIIGTVIQSVPYEDQGKQYIELHVLDSLRVFRVLITPDSFVNEELKARLINGETDMFLEIVSFYTAREQQQAFFSYKAHSVDYRFPTEERQSNKAVSETTTIIHTEYRPDDNRPSILDGITAADYSYTMDSTESDDATVDLSVAFQSKNGKCSAKLAGKVEQIKLPSGFVFWEGPLVGVVTVDDVEIPVVAGFSKKENAKDICLTITFSVDGDKEGKYPLVMTVGEGFITDEIYEEIQSIGK